MIPPQLHPYASLAWGIVSSVYKVVRNQVTTDQKLIALVGTMESVYSFVDAIQSNVAEKVKVLENVIKKIFAQTIECAMYIQEYSKQGGFVERTLRGMLKDNAGTIEKLTQNLLDLKKEFDSGVGVHTAIVSFRIQEDVGKILTKQTLLELAPADLQSSIIAECLPSTRQDVLSEIITWATDPSGVQNVLWLYGLAGSGKTTISVTIGSFFRDLGRLGSLIVFTRTLPEQSQPSKVIRTLAYNLGTFDPRIGTAIQAAIDSYPGFKDAKLKVQFTKLIVEPLASLPDLQTGGPIVMVFDGLDECGNPQDREQLLDLLGNHMSSLPSIFRVLVVSRPLENITNVFQGKPNIRTWDLEMSGRDVMAYFEYHLQDIQRIKLPRRRDWPGNEVIHDLAARSCGLFIWASTAVNFISKSPAKRLDVIRRGEKAPSAQSSLDELYTTALLDAYDWEDDMVEIFRTVLEVILVLQNPVPTSTLDQIIGLSDSEDEGSNSVVTPLACVIAHDPTLHLLHPSFADFLFSRERCGRDIWHFSPVICHRNVTQKCLDRLSNNGLKRNICNLTLSASPNGEKVPDDIAYACAFWITHMCTIDEDVLSLFEDLESFMTKHLLHWFEAMSILGKSRVTIPLLGNLHCWTSANFSDQHSLVDFVRDAWHFAQTFAALIEEHPLLVYHGALPFTPITSSIYQIFHDSQTCPTVCGGFSQSWTGLQLVLSHAASVESVACSQDGTRIVTGSADSTVHVWDAISGAEVLPPLVGHLAAINSVAFSWDGTCIASGSSDNTVRIWDAVTGTEVLFSPLGGHDGEVSSLPTSRDGTRIISGSDSDSAPSTEVETPLHGNENEIVSVDSSPDGTPNSSGSEDSAADSLSGSGERSDQCLVLSVAFSRDGTRIASGTSEGSVRIWDAVTGIEVVSSPIRLEGIVCSVAFSPDSSAIVSGSSDNTVRIWNVESGTALRPTLRGHQDTVNSVAFSPDGSRIVSGSDDNTVRVWNVVSGSEAFSPLLGHEDEVNSVAFSPDNTRIISGSNDGTVRIWDAASGTEVASLLRRHGTTVTAVAFSPDAHGTRILSGSGDCTVRIWDALSDAAVVPRPRRHGGCVGSITFSRDGTRVVSGSEDNTVRVWDAVSGTEIFTLLGHNNEIELVSFSSDGTRIVSGSNDENVGVWNSVDGTEAIPFLEGFKPESGLWVSPDGTRVASACYDGTVFVWDAVRGTLAFPLLLGAHNDIAFSRDISRIACASMDSTVHLLDATSGTELPCSPLRGHEGTVHSVAFSSDGTRVVSGSSDNTVRIWNSSSGVEVTPVLRGHQDPVGLVMFNSNDTHMVSVSLEKTCIWDTTTWEELTQAQIQRCDGLNDLIPFTTVLNDKGWVKDICLRRSITKVPPMVAASCMAACGKSVAFGTEGGDVLIMNLPETVSGSHETRPA
ncbi:hypothetical protein PILCRDRAFT_614766 [Piloderma croceum F 1598]|uniref:Nephrocystin 3-like N-terminal domain-containing protein n=1 Tax=Piloderma croceum (strain F 1598) TaxID=765440 RepID=A0A0C3BJU4_PILCF|nr:hypothetical protein PILCRDRAFT_614766 [Piloderma croceum F 1598]